MCIKVAIDINSLVNKLNDLPPFEQEKIKNIVDEAYEDFEDQKLYDELDKIKEEMANGIYFTSDQIKWND